MSKINRCKGALAPVPTVTNKGRVLSAELVRLPYQSQIDIDKLRTEERNYSDMLTDFWADIDPTKDPPLEYINDNEETPELVY